MYNAIHDTNFKIGEVTIKPVTLENIVYRDIENDVSMEINNSIVVIAEHQSTINNNMPFRCLEYLVAHYNRFFDEKDKYHEKQISLPRPECYVFYNGDAPFPKEKVMKLSDAFKNLTDTEFPNSLTLDLAVKVYNINKTSNHPILKKCEPLLAYSEFTEYARIGKRNRVKNPAKYALDKCKQGKVLTNYFNNLSKEEQSMIFGEWDWDAYIKVHSEEVAEDRAIESARNFLKENISPEVIARCCALPLEEVLALKKEIESEATAALN